jgi:hypothetical protein
MGYSSMLLGKGFDQPYRSVKEIINYLSENPFKSESEIQEDVFNYYRKDSFESNKKYADMLRRGLNKGLISSVERKVVGTRSRIFYFIPKK